MCWVESRTVLPLRERSRDLSAGGARRLTRAGQQAPGFCAQKSSNFCAFDPAGGGLSLDWLSAPAVGAAAPPPLEVPSSVPPAPPVPLVSGAAVAAGVGVAVPVEVPVDVPELPDVPVDPVSPLDVPESAVPVGVGVGVAVLEPDASSPVVAASADCGIGTSA